MNWKDKLRQNRINTEFILGKYYKLRDGYILPTDAISYYTFEGRTTYWNEAKINGFKNGQINKCINNSTLLHDDGRVEIVFDKVDSGSWVYHPKDFVEVPQ